MQIGVVGLGRMGANIARRLMRRGHRCVVFDQNAAAALTGDLNLKVEGRGLAECFERQ